MRPERRRRILAPLGVVGSQEAVGRLTGRLVRVSAVADVRTREVQALRFRDGHKVAVQQTIGRHHRRVLQARDLTRLLDDEVALRLEDREEQHLRGTRSDLGQHRNHVRIALVHGGERGDRPSMGLERIGECLGQPLRVGVTVVDGRSSRHTEHLDSETSCRSALV